MAFTIIHTHYTLYIDIFIVSVHIGEEYLFLFYFLLLTNMLSTYTNIVIVILLAISVSSTE